MKWISFESKETWFHIFYKVCENDTGSGLYDMDFSKSKIPALDILRNDLGVVIICGLMY